MSPRVYGMHHVGITVPDLGEAVAFFEAVFGAVKVLSTGPFDVPDSFMSDTLGAAPQSRIKDLVMLRCGNSTNVELFEYIGDETGRAPKKNSEVGATHLCFQVDDAHAATERLKKRGIEFFDGPHTNSAGTLEGLTWVYFKAPWGQSMEIVSGGVLGYEAGTDKRLWSPKG
jgi:catechol 2,3-dioxygenase-like lactoylglutathione lyase family enzyme